jgi:hypothetical protein
MSQAGSPFSQGDVTDGTAQAPNPQPRSLLYFLESSQLEFRTWEITLEPSMNG